MLSIVWQGATTIESPVCIPIGSKFSILQIVIQLPCLSLITSYSISFQPYNDFSIKICGTHINALCASCLRVSSFSASPLPSPPKAKADLVITG